MSGHTTWLRLVMFRQTVVALKIQLLLQVDNVVESERVNTHAAVKSVKFNHTQDRDVRCFFQISWQAIDYDIRVGGERVVFDVNREKARISWRDDSEDHDLTFVVACLKASCKLRRERNSSDKQSGKMGRLSSGWNPQGNLSHLLKRFKSRALEKFFLWWCERWNLQKDERDEEDLLFRFCERDFQWWCVKGGWDARYFI